MKLIFESWRNFVEQQNIEELFIHGEKPSYGQDYIIAYGKDVWIFGIDEVPYEQAHEIISTLDLDYDLDEDEDLDFHDFQGILEDSGRPDVVIGAIHNGKWLSLSNHGSFVFDPQSSVLIKKIVKQLNLSGVTRPAGEEEETTSKYKIQGQIAKEMYHGTTDKYLENLLKMGLRPGVRKTNYDAISHPNAVFFTSRFEEAAHHAVHTNNKTKSDGGNAVIPMGAAAQRSFYQSLSGKPVVLKLKVPDQSLLIPDYDIDVGAENVHYDYISQKLRNRSREYGAKMPGKSFSLSKEFGIYGYKGRIPPNHIVGIAVALEETEYPEVSDFVSLSREETKNYLYTLEHFGEGNPYYDPSDYEDEED
jgi:hypothetical protein